MFTGDIVEYPLGLLLRRRAFHGLAGDHRGDPRPSTSTRSHPGEATPLVGKARVAAALDNTIDFVTSTYRPIARVARGGGSLKQAWDACRAACDPKFAAYAIYEHCLPFNVARAFDEALGVDTPRIWTAERDLAMWAALQG